MTDNSKSIKYFPLTELILFLIATTLIFVVVNNFNLSNWISLLLTSVSYFIFLGGTNLITLTGDKIQITFLNLIGGQVSIELNKVTKIWTTETFEQETTIDFETGYYLFKRNYNMEYIDKKDKKRLLNFRINNKKKESEIITRINRFQKTELK